MTGENKNPTVKGKKGTSANNNGDSFRLSGGGMKFVTLVIICVLAIGSTIYNIASAQGKANTIEAHQNIHCKKFDETQKHIERHENKIDNVAQKQAEMAGDIKVIRTLLEQAMKSKTDNK